jgi:hypothetical protein
VDGGFRKGWEAWIRACRPNRELVAIVGKLVVGQRDEWLVSGWVALRKDWLAKNLGKQ